MTDDTTEHLTLHHGEHAYVYRVADDGEAELIDGPDNPPDWIDKAADRYAEAVRQQGHDLARRGDALVALQSVWPAVQSLARIAVFEGKNGREYGGQLANKLQAIGQRSGTPEDLRQWAGDAESQLRGHLKRAAPPKRSDDSGPTPETAAKLRKPQKDVIDRLYENGVIDGDQHDAAEEIRSIYEAVSKRLTARARDYRDVKVQTTMGAPLDPSGALPSRLARLHGSVYTPWCAELKQRPAVERGNAQRGSHYAMMMDVLIKGKSIREIIRAYSLRNGEGGPRVADGLRRYLQLRKAPPEEPAQWPYEAESA